jgi:hypothetical protein
MEEKKYSESIKEPYTVKKFEESKKKASSLKDLADNFEE